VIEDALVSKSEEEDFDIIKDQNIPAYDTPEAPVVPPAAPKVTEVGEETVAAVSAEDKIRLVQKILPNLNPNRFTDYDKWKRMGFGLKGVFRDEPERGLDLFLEGSSKAQNYNKGDCQTLYLRGNGSVGFGSFVTWLREDQPESADALLAWRPTEEATPAQQEEAEPQKDVLVDFNKLERWDAVAASELNHIAREMKIAGKYTDAELSEFTKRQYEIKNKLKIDIIQYMNLFFFTIVKSRKVVYGEICGLPTDAVKGQDELIMRKKDSLIEVSENHKSKVFKRTFIQLWREHTARREYHSLVMDPSSSTSTKYHFNLFTGFDIPRDDDYELDDDIVQPVKDHIMNIWCQGNLDQYEYVLNWMAHLRQKPWIKIGVALVLQSSPGAGKGVIIDLLAKTLGKKYYNQIKNPEKSMYGQFTPENWETCLLLFFDEASWGGEKQRAGILKKIITEDTMEIEGKFGARFSVDSFLNTIIASNETWLIPADMKARRWCCMTLANTYSGMKEENVPYFLPIRNCPAKAFAAMLDRRDISKFDTRSPPMTELLREQKLLKFDNVTQFWDQTLNDGGVPEWGPHFPPVQTGLTWPDELDGHFMPNQTLYESFVQFVKQKGSGRHGTSAEFICASKKLIPFKNKSRVQRKVSGRTVSVMMFPELKEAQDFFCDQLDDPD